HSDRYERGRRLTEFLHELAAHLCDKGVIVGLDCSALLCTASFAADRVAVARLYAIAFVGQATPVAHFYARSVGRRDVVMIACKVLRRDLPVNVNGPFMHASDELCAA